MTLNLGSKVIGTDTDRSATYDFLLTFHSNHGLISYRFRDKRRFKSKIASFSHPVYFAEGVPLGIEYRRSGPKKLEWWGYRAEKGVWPYLQPSGYNTPTWLTDGRTDTLPQQDRASRGRVGKKRHMIYNLLMTVFMGIVLLQAVNCTSVSVTVYVYGVCCMSRNTHQRGTYTSETIGSTSQCHTAIACSMPMWQNCKHCGEAIEMSCMSGDLVKLICHSDY